MVWNLIGSFTIEFPGLQYRRDHAAPVERWAGADTHVPTAVFSASAVGAAPRADARTQVTACRHDAERGAFRRKESTMQQRMQQRVNYTKAAPGLYEAMDALDQYVRGCG